MLVLIFGTMLYFLVKYRSSKRVDRKMPKLPTTAIEVTWTVIPLLLMMGLYGWAWKFISRRNGRLNAVEIDVVGKQWMWKMEQWRGGFGNQSIARSCQQAIKLTLASQDVIHSFFVPAFRIKQDVVPGRYSRNGSRRPGPGRTNFLLAILRHIATRTMVGEVVVDGASGV